MINIESLQHDASNIEVFEAGTIIFKDGEPTDSKMYIILQGNVDVFKNHNKHGEMCIATLAQGDFFGEMSLFIEKGRTATVVAANEVTTVVIDRSSVLDFLKSNPESMFSFVQSLCVRLDSTSVNAADNVVRYEQDLAVLSYKKKELEAAANTDALTGAYNRRYFMENANILIDAAAQMNKHSFVAMFDLDHFKKINDTYGHKAGDHILTVFADTVNDSVRSNDIFARYGGEEFVLLITFVYKADVIKLVERIRQTICENPILFSGSKISVSTSVGVAPVEKGGIEAAISNADIALYRAKSEGRNKMIFYKGI